jgi:hypothetical protein
LPEAQHNDKMHHYYYEKLWMEAELSRFISAGMPLDEARKVMENNGFRCEEIIVYPHQVASNGRGDAGLSCLRCYVHMAKDERGMIESCV